MPESDPDPEAAPLLIVTDDSAAEPESWPRGAKRVAAIEYLTGAASTARAGARVLNQSTATRYLEAGYYVSLLAAARGHKVQPTAAQLLDAALPQERDRKSAELPTPLRAPARRGDCRLAILIDPDESEPPSNSRALERFLSAAAALGMHAELITAADASRLSEFDALFIRKTTALWNHTYALARRAAELGLFVVDDAESILHCCNKLFLAELLARHSVATPRTLAVHRGNAAEVLRKLGLPCILKQPDGWSSRGMLLVRSEKELRDGIEQLIGRGALLVAQEFVPTGFDWRIGILDGQPIYASKYYMVPDHWQVVRRSSDGERLAEGPDEPVALELVPPPILQLAVRAAELCGDSFYGVDLKEVDGRALVIEVNDNPSVDAGIEDTLLEDELYLRIMRIFRTRILAARQSARAS